MSSPAGFRTGLALRLGLSRCRGLSRLGVSRMYRGLFRALLKHGLDLLEMAGTVKENQKPAGRRGLQERQLALTI